MADGSQAPGAAFEVVSFGCRLNTVESQAIAERAASSAQAPTVVFNTCAVTSEAVRQARQAIRKARREQPDARLIVTGCAAEIDPGAFAAMDEVDLVVGNAAKNAPDAFATDGERVRVNPFAMARFSAPGNQVTGPARARGYVEIQNGCDHRCTFCIIPFGRGHARSRPAEDVIAQVRLQAAAGHGEIVLTGVDLTSWGGDLEGAPSLGVLVRRILREVPEARRLRLSSIDTAEIDDVLMETLATETRLMPHLHLSLQSGDDLILKRMKRRHNRADALALIEAVRLARPGVAFGADLIAGFPTESETAFDNTLSFVADARLAFLHVFPFSARPGTPAARMPQVPRVEVLERARRLRQFGEAALGAHLQRLVGTTLTALVETEARARAEDFTELTFDGEAPEGSLIVGRVTSHDGRRAHLGAWRAA